MFDGYPEETLGPDDDCGVMVENVQRVRDEVVGHRIAKAEQDGSSFVITLDNGKAVRLRDTDDCCAYTSLGSFLLHADRIDHVITGVGTTNGYQTWHIFADLGDVLELSVGWSCGNPFYYAYGFDITVENVDQTAATR